jgi:hypothetical protein
MNPVVIKLTIPGELAETLEAQRPKTLPTATFCAFLIEQGLDRPSLPSGMVLKSRGDKGGFKPLNSSLKEEQEEQPSKDQRSLEKKKRKEKPVFSSRNISPDLVPGDLLDCQQLLPEFWSVKKGVRSESVWNRICGRLRYWTPEQRREALERAIASGWGDVFEPKANTPAQAKGSSNMKRLPNGEVDWDAYDHVSFFK